MELVQILESLWRRRAAVAAAAVLALLAAIAVGTRGETVQGGTASAEILVDARQSALGDLRRETLPLVARSAIFARLLGADGATDAIAREAGVPKDDIVVVGPALRIDGVPDQASAERATEVSQGAGRLVQVQQGDDLPLLTIFTRAPTEDEARGLADGTAVALETYVSEYQERAEIPEPRQVTIRQLGPARAREFSEAPGVVLPFAVFGLFLVTSCLAILAWPSVTASWRASGAWRTARPLIVARGLAQSPNGGETPTRRAALHRVLAAIGLREPAGSGKAEPEDGADPGAPSGGDGHRVRARAEREPSGGAPRTKRTSPTKRTPATKRTSTK